MFFRQMILTGCVAFAQHVGPTRVETELLPQCWEQVGNRQPAHFTVKQTSKTNTIYSTGELGYDRLNGTRKISPSYAKSVIQWSVISKFTCIILPNLFKGCCEVVMNFEYKFIFGKRIVELLLMVFNLYLICC